MSERNGDLFQGSFITSDSFPVPAHTIHFTLETVSIAFIDPVKGNVCDFPRCQSV